jgi:adenylate cyclase
MTDLAALLRQRGVPDDEIARAEAHGRDALVLLTIDRLILPAGRRYTRGEVIARSGVDAEFARRLWRAMGFPDPGEEPVFTDADVRDLRALQSLTALGLADADVALQMTRVIGRAMAQIADAEVAVTRARVEGQLGDGSPMDDVGEVVARTAEVLLPALEQFLVDAWRRHLAAAARRQALSAMDSDEAGAPTEMAVGFADLVGFTAISQQLDEHELAVAVGRFEDIAYGAVADGGARVVKMIGDEVMYVGGNLGDAVSIGLNLADLYSEDEMLPDVRVGLTWGSVLARDGDFFGPTVNLASRIVNIAYAGSTVVSESVHEALADDGRFSWKALRPRRLKGIGWTPLWVVGRAGERPKASMPADVRRRIHERRERRERSK